MRERIGREDRVVEDHRLGLATEEADFQFVPELIRIGTRLAVAEPVEPAASLFAMPEAVVGHGQEGPVERRFRPVTCLDCFYDRAIPKPTAAPTRT